MQNLGQLPPDYLAQLSKLDQLLRMCQVVKHSGNFKQIKGVTKARAQKIVKTLRNHGYFEAIEQEVNMKIQHVFDEQDKNTIKSSTVPQDKIKPINKQSINTSQKSGISGAPPSILKHSRSSPSKKQVVETPQPPAKPFQKIEAPQPLQKKKQVQNKQREKIVVVEEKPVYSIPSAFQFSSESKGVLQEQKQHGSGSGLIQLQSEIQVQKGIESGDSAKFSSSHEKFPKSISSIDQKEERKESGSGSFMFDQSNSNDKLKSKEEDASSSRSQKQSEGSHTGQVLQSLGTYLQQQQQKLNYFLVFNNELFQSMDEQLDGHFYLFGVNKPDSAPVNHLYACTLMKFLTAELHHTGTGFQKQIKDFENSIRVPVGLIFKAETPAKIRPEHIKFMLDVNSPFPVVLILKDDSGDEGYLCSFSDEIVEKIKVTPKKQLNQWSDLLIKHTTVLSYGKDHFPADKNKIATKFLHRQIPKLAEEAPNAITISGNDCIREEKQCFLYKLHTKFQNNIKGEFTIYYVHNNVVDSRISFKEKQFDAFQKEVLEGQSKVTIILSINLNKETAPVKKEFFELLLLSKNKRDPFFFINFSSLKPKKTLITTLRQDLTLDKLKQIEPLPFKQFEKDTVLTNCLHVLHVKNVKQFEADPTVELTEVKK